MFQKKLRKLVCIFVVITLVASTISPSFVFAEEANQDISTEYKSDNLSLYYGYTTDEETSNEYESDNLPQYYGKISEEDQSTDNSYTLGTYDENDLEEDYNLYDKYESHNLPYGSIAALGIPIMPLSLITGTINNANGQGNATWTFDPITNTVTVHGPTPAVPDPWANQQGRGSNNPWTRAPYNIPVEDIHRIVFEGPVRGGQLLQGLFNGLTYLTEIVNLHYLDMADVATFQHMFRGTSSLTTIDVSSFFATTRPNGTRRPTTNFNGTFQNTGATTIIGLETWDMSYATNVSQLFMDARYLQSINATGWSFDNLHNGAEAVRGFNQMFEGTSSLHTIYGIEGWNIGQIITTNRMFRDALSFNQGGNLDLSGWNVSSLTTTSHMFNGARSLEVINTTGWDTGNVVNMNHMFANHHGMDQLVNTVHALASIIGIEGWDTSSVRYMQGMFSNAFMLPSHDLSGWNTGNVVNMQNMFNAARSLTTLDLSNWNVSNVQFMQNMFAFTENLTTIGDIRNWNTGNVVSMQGMFRETAIQELNLSNWNTSNVTNMFEMFRGAENLWRLNIRGFNTSNIGMAGPPIPGNMQNMFMDTFALRQITLGEDWNVFNGGNITNLPDVPDNGYWRNVGRSYDTPGTVSAPVGGHFLASGQLMGNVLPPGEIADTWIWVDRDHYQIIFDLNGGNVNGDTSNIVHNLPVGIPVGAERIPGPILRGDFTFTGWRYVGQADGTPNLTDLQVAQWVVTGTRTFVAQWIGRTHTVRFNLEGGRVGVSYADWIHTIPYGEQIGTIRVPTPSRFPTHSFVGWRYVGQADSTPNFSIQDAADHVVVADIVFVAQWVHPPLGIYDVTFNLDGGTYNGNPGDIIHAVYAGSPVSADNVPHPVIRPGHVLAGWRYNGQPAVTANLTCLEVARWVVTGHIIFTAQWETDQFVTFPVTYTAGAGTGGPFTDIVAPGDNAKFAPSVTGISRPGYEFAGWLVEGSNPTVVQPGELLAVSGPLTLVAQWASTGLLTVRYESGLGTGGPRTVEKLQIGHSHIIYGNDSMQFVRPGFRFTGWIIEGSAALHQPGQTITVNSNLTLIAQWAPVNNESGTNGGTNGGDNGGIVSQPPTSPPQPPIPPPQPPTPQPPTPPQPEPPTQPEQIQTPPQFSPPPPPELTEAPLPSRRYLRDLLSPLDPIPMSPYHFAYMIGHPDGYIRPNNNITRAEVATIFFRLMCDSHRASIWSQENAFPDVELDNWFNNAISTLASAGLLQGYPDGYFRPNQIITRAEFSALVVRIMGYGHNLNFPNIAFTDTVGHWAEGYINVAYILGWIQGYEGGTFKPDQPITRAEAAALVNRALGRLPQFPDDLLPGMIIWPDNRNTKAWYYLYIQEATNSHYYVIKICGIHETWTELFEPREWWRLERPYSTPDIFIGN